MRVTIFPCGEVGNHSELSAIEHLKSRLQNIGGNDEWIVLTNLAFSVTHQFQSDEIDMVVLGPPGVRVIEDKHWTAQWVDFHKDLVEREADKVTNKARKIGTTLRRIVGDLPRVDGAILLTQPHSRVRKLVGRDVRGVRFHTLKQWKEAIGSDDPRTLSPSQVKSQSRTLEPQKRGCGRWIASPVGWIRQPGTPDAEGRTISPRLQGQPSRTAGPSYRASLRSVGQHRQQSGRSRDRAKKRRSH